MRVCCGEGNPRQNERRAIVSVITGEIVDLGGESRIGESGLKGRTVEESEATYFIYSGLLDCVSDSSS